jgi:hypothetical protein
MPAKGCRPLGERCMKDGDCCAAGPMACRKDATGTSRCLGPMTPGVTCSEVGFPCSVPEQCCGGHCLPDGTGALVCRDACAPDGAGCHADEDCCGGACVGAPGQTVCASGPAGDARCTRAGDPCDSLVAACCAGTVCAVVTGGGHACALVPP